jgi:hydrogenase maturation protein HypF
LTKGKHAFVSQHIGDLENGESYKFFGEAIDHLQNILEIRPEVVVYDLHPDYFSTRWALAQTGVELIGVQHHHAHIASCMAENHLDGRVIGCALDGTGYGTDGHIWGGEVLIAGYEDFERAAHFEYIPLPGGSAAIREPWRTAVSYLFRHFGRDFLKLDIPFARGLDPNKTEFLLRMMQQEINSPLTSSCGRLFDAVAAFVGIRQQVNYEAQAAIELEMAIDGEGDDAYPLNVARGSEPWTIGTRPLFEAIIEDLQLRTPSGTISRRFHNGLVNVFVEIAEGLRIKTGLNRVCLSGGTFHNVYLSGKLERSLAACGFEVFTQREVPAGDGGLSVGQALVGARRFLAAKRTAENNTPSGVS